MKKAIFALAIIFVLLLGVFFLPGLVRQKVFRDLSSKNSTGLVPSPTPLKKNISSSIQKTSEFVPYWTMTGGIDSDTDGLIYFGVSPNISGINRDEEGYRLLSRFLDLAGDKKKYLAVRMLDQNISTQILESQEIQDRVIADSVRTAKENNFDGIVVDLEYKALPFDSVISGINNFFTNFSHEAKKHDLKFSVLIYGDNFYRVRPYDLKHIGKNSDEVMIMAYDFHKSGGNPGPNFPLDGDKKYGYTFKEMIEDFSRAVPSDKLTVVFGMFGYDWQVDDNGTSLGKTIALSLAQMKDRFVNGCGLTECSLKRDSLSSESVATYKDEDGVRHTVWFEDEESAQKKKDFLKEQGIGSVSYWAHSYY